MVNIDQRLRKSTYIYAENIQGICQTHPSKYYSNYLLMLMKRTVVLLKLLALLMKLLAVLDCSCDILDHVDGAIDHFDGIVIHVDENILTFC